MQQKICLYNGYRDRATDLPLLALRARVGKARSRAAAPVRALPHALLERQAGVTAARPAAEEEAAQIADEGKQQMTDAQVLTLAIAVIVPLETMLKIHELEHHK